MRRAVRYDRDSVRLEPFENLRLSVGDCLFRPEVLDVRGRDRGDNRDVRAYLRGQRADLARLFMPISRTANSASRGIRARLSGTPVWLL